MADLTDLEFESVGDIDPDSANDANVPVDIWLHPPTTDEEETEEDPLWRTNWKLTADNYMPRKARLSGEHSYKLYAKDRETLVAIIHRCWLPIFQAAVKKLTDLTPDEDGVADLYYWHE